MPPPSTSPPRSPRLDARRSPAGTLARRLAFGAWLGATLGYLAWRALATRNPAAPAWSWLFLGLEAWACACSVLFYLVQLERRAREAPPARPGWTVDVFVCSYNEPLAMVRQTLRRALALDYPHRVWLLDDGDRPAARALAQELGCDYLARGRNTDFKAGNLNHALARSSGDLVLVLDADHLVREHLLSRLLGYFDDPRVALVQTPQVYCNVDSFQHHVEADGRRLWHEGAIFHHVLQPGADRWNAAFFVGTGAVLRRAALDSIGGFATGTVTEDCHTSLRLHARGWESVFHDEPLGFLQAPHSLLQYLTQRLRWGQGSMQILRRENPLTLPGLTLRQRLVYFNSLASFGQAIVHLAWYVAPAAFLLGAAPPLLLEEPAQFAPLLLHVAVDVAAFRFFLGPLARPLLAECYKFLNVWVFLRSLAGLFARERLRFVVTSKGRDPEASPLLLAPQLALLLLNATAFTVGCLRLGAAGSPAARLGILTATLFAAAFVIVGGTASAFAWQRRAARGDYPYPDDLPALLPDGGRAELVRVNARFLQLLLPPGAALPAAGDRLDLRVELGAGAVALSGSVTGAREVRAQDRAGPPRALLSLSLEPLAPEVADRLYDRLAERTIPGLLARLDGAAAGGEDAGPGPLWYLPIEPNVL